MDARAVGVAAEDGAVTLTGFIDTYAGKLAAERAAKRVAGVRAVANDIDVRLKLARTDADIAQDVTRALKPRSTVSDGVQAIVHSGRVTLTGAVQWLYQKDSAERAVRLIRGVRAVFNHITVTPTAAVRDVRRLIVKALHHAADVDARHVTVQVSGHTATLSGTAARGADGLLAAVPLQPGRAPGGTQSVEAGCFTPRRRMRRSGGPSTNSWPLCL